LKRNGQTEFLLDADALLPTVKSKDKHLVTSLENREVKIHEFRMI
jgi:hypothetical protein